LAWHQNLEGVTVGHLAFPFIKGLRGGKGPVIGEAWCRGKGALI